MADPTDTEVDEAPEGAGESSVMKELRAKAKRAEQAEARVAEMERKFALAEAGLSGLSDKQVKALLSTHEGDISGEALKATAAELGFGAPVAEQETQDPEVAGELETLSGFSGGAVQREVPQGARDAVVKQAAEGEFKSMQEYVAYLHANADVLAP